MRRSRNRHSRARKPRCEIFHSSSPPHQFSAVTADRRYIDPKRRIADGKDSRNVGGAGTNPPNHLARGEAEILSAGVTVSSDFIASDTPRGAPYPTYPQVKAVPAIKDLPHRSFRLNVTGLLSSP
jgi:hypothetical protein